MPFEFSPVRPSNIAIIGAGISGMAAAHELSKSHKVTLFENEARLGGHARTVMSGKNGDQPVDTGFIVFNYQNYPCLTNLFDELGVPVEKSDMSFGISANGGQVEYALASLKGLFAQSRNIVNPAFLGMLRDITKFNKRASAMPLSNDVTLGALLDELNMGEWFRKYYLLPFSGAIWSTPMDEMLKFPAQALIQFFQNHNLMQTSDHHQWYTVSGGSISYVQRLQVAMVEQGVDIRLASPVQGVRRDADGVFVRSKGSEWERFDRVVFACHSDDALAMLEAPTKSEHKLLGDIKYQDNKAVLHRDPQVMPMRKKCWSSWVYSTQKDAGDDAIGVTYWMNRLQNIPQDDLLLETLNPSHDIKDELIYEETNFRHPVFDHAALTAQPKLEELQGRNNTWFCGAYMRNGFHEDGIASGLSAARHMGNVAQWA